MNSIDLQEIIDNVFKILEEDRNFKRQAYTTSQNRLDRKEANDAYNLMMGQTPELKLEELKGKNTLANTGLSNKGQLDVEKEKSAGAIGRENIVSEWQKFHARSLADAERYKADSQKEWQTSGADKQLEGTYAQALGQYGAGGIVKPEDLGAVRKVLRGEEPTLGNNKYGADVPASSAKVLEKQSRTTPMQQPVREDSSASKHLLGRQGMAANMLTKSQYGAELAAQRLKQGFGYAADFVAPEGTRWTQGIINNAEDKLTKVSNAWRNVGKKKKPGEY